MSAINDLFVQGERAILTSGHSDTLTVLTGHSAGSQIEGRLDVEPVLDASMELGADPRMQTVFRVLYPFPILYLNDVLTDGKIKYKVIKEENNAASVTADFWLEQQL